MRVAIRTDASVEIGTGHVMRCLTLADRLRERGARCEFICRAHDGNLADAIRERGHSVTDLPVRQIWQPSASLQGESLGIHSAWLGDEWIEDVRQTSNALGSDQVEWLIVDHYAIDEKWEGNLRSACRHLMVIDDLADRPHDCDLLLDQNLGRNATDYVDRVAAPQCIILCGAQYALLRPEFNALRAYSIGRQRDTVRRLLISMGGVDKNNVTGKVLETLRTCDLPADCRITVVLGRHAPWTEIVKRQMASMPLDSELLVDVPDMAKLIADSDLAIGAAGASAWERCCLGVPTIVVILAENQRPGALALERSGAALVVQDQSSIANLLPGAVMDVMKIGRMRLMQAACGSVTDGLGASRIVDGMMGVSRNG